MQLEMILLLKGFDFVMHIFFTSVMRRFFFYTDLEIYDRFNNMLPPDGIVHSYTCYVQTVKRTTTKIVDSITCCIMQTALCLHMLYIHCHPMRFVQDNTVGISVRIHTHRSTCIPMTYIAIYNDRN